MRRLVIGPICLLLIGGGVAAGTAAESLADAARREAERRAKQKSDKPVKTYGEVELATAKGDTYTQVEGPALTPSPTPSGGSRIPGAVGPTRVTAAVGPSRSASPGAGESVWRGRVQQARSRITRLEAEVRELDARATNSAYGSASPSCLEPPVRDSESVRRYQDCLRRKRDAPFRHQAERTQTLGRLARAREELAEAKRALVDLEEEARRAGAPPGWLR